MSVHIRSAGVQFFCQKDLALVYTALGSTKFSPVKFVIDFMLCDSMVRGVDDTKTTVS